MFAPFFLALVLAVLPVSAAPRPSPTAGASTDAAPEKAPPSPPTWLGRINAGPAGAFPPPRSFTASYRVTWADVEAAHVEAKCTSPDGGAEIQTAVKAGTIGGARLLWKMDATSLCVADRSTLRPVRYEQKQETSNRHISVRVDFSAQEAVRSNLDPAAPENREKQGPRHFAFPGMFDMHTALLYMRSLPLNAGEEKTLPVMAANTPYLVTIKVIGHEKVAVKAGEFPAIVCTLSLQKINKHGELEPHKGFKSARTWISDDANRILLKIETQVFVGNVNLELEKVTF